MTDSYLDNFRPQTSIFDQFKVEDGLPVEEKAFAVWKTLLSAKRSADGLFLVIGKYLKMVRDERLYVKLNYENFTQFLADEEISISREKAYMCIKVYETYIDYLEMNPEDVGKMNVSRLSMMVPMIKNIENKEEAVKKVEELNALRLGDLVQEVKNKTNRAGKPSVYWNEEIGRWYVNYYSNTTYLYDNGEFVPPVEDEPTN